MKRWRVDAYLVEVRELHGRSNLKFGQFDGSQSLRSVLKSILAKNHRHKNISHLQRSYKVKLDPSNIGALTGFFQYGEYGFASEIVDTNSGSVAHNKKKHESNLEPYYFHLEVPDHETRGILCVQQGIKSVFKLVVADEFGVLYPQFRMHVKNLAFADELKQYIKSGLIEEIIVEKHEIPADIADRFGGGSRVYQGKFSYSIEPKDKGLFKRGGLVAYLNGTKSIDEMFDLDDHEFDEVKAKVRIGRGVRTLNLTKQNPVSMSVDITDSVKIGPNGYPTAQSLKGEFKDIVSELAQRGGIQI